MNYSQALSYLQGTNRAFCKPGTERVLALCSAVGDPQKDLSVVHVAGTNGKGSFCLLLAALLQSAGFCVGRFSSPALCEITETITVNGEEISKEEFARIITQLQPIADRETDRPTEFEILTAAAVLYFRDQQCDFVLLECGMGGLNDATNIIDRPLLSVITGIALDHTAFLGETVSEIARQKAGIIKKNCPVLWCGNDREAEAVISDAARNLHAPFHTVPLGTLKIQKADLSGTVFDFDRYKNLPLSLLGLYQAQNGANALAALNLLCISLAEEKIAAAFSSVCWKGRFEVLSADPLVIADGGHNRQGVEKAVESIEAYFPHQKITFVSGILADKDYPAVARRMADVAEHVYTVTPPNPRALSAEAFGEVFRSLGIAATPCHSVKEAVEKAVADGRPIVCLGSLYTYGEIRSALEK